MAEASNELTRRLGKRAENMSCTLGGRHPTCEKRVVGNYIRSLFAPGDRAIRP